MSTEKFLYKVLIADDQFVTPKFPGVKSVTNGNDAVAYVISRLCAVMIGYPITPSTEIAEIVDVYRASGQTNIWGEWLINFEAEGEHSAQSGANGAAMIGGALVANATSSQGLLYAIESLVATMGKRAAGFVLHVAARAITTHSLNVMAGHDDVYAAATVAKIPVIFASTPTEAADFAAIAYQASILAQLPFVNAMDGFDTSHLFQNTLLPEPELLKAFITDPKSRIDAQTVAQEIAQGDKGRNFRLVKFMMGNISSFQPTSIKALAEYLLANEAAIETPNHQEAMADSLKWVPEQLQERWQAVWEFSYEKGTRQAVPAIVDIDNPTWVSPVQNQPEHMSGTMSHRVHWLDSAHGFVKQVMTHYGKLTGRNYAPLMGYQTDDAEHIIVAMGSVTESIKAVVDYERARGKKVGVVSVKMFFPFPEADLIPLISGKKTVTVLERSDGQLMQQYISSAMAKALTNGSQKREIHRGIPPLSEMPLLLSGAFGIGGRDILPGHIVAAFKNAMSTEPQGYFYLGPRFFSSELELQDNPVLAMEEAKLREAYPHTVKMSLPLEENPDMYSPEAVRTLVDSVGGWGTMAFGKMLGDILVELGVFGSNSIAAPKYGSEKKGAPTSIAIAIDKAEIRGSSAPTVYEVRMSVDDQIFKHAKPLTGLIDGGTLVLQSRLASALEVWKSIPAEGRAEIRRRNIKVHYLNSFKIAKEIASDPSLLDRMVGMPFLGAFFAASDRVTARIQPEDAAVQIEKIIRKKFGKKAGSVVDENIALMRRGMAEVKALNLESDEILAFEKVEREFSQVQQAMTSSVTVPVGSPAEISQDFNLEKWTATHFPDRFKETVLAVAAKYGLGAMTARPGIGSSIPAGTATIKNKGLWTDPETIPNFEHRNCTGCMECAQTCMDDALHITARKIEDILATGLMGFSELQRTNAEFTNNVEQLLKQISDLMNRQYQAQTSRAQIKGRYTAEERKSFNAVLSEALAAISRGEHNAEALKYISDNLQVPEGYQWAMTANHFNHSRRPKGFLFSVDIDTSKCTGCFACVEECKLYVFNKEGNERGRAQIDQAHTFFKALPSRVQGLTYTPGQNITPDILLDHQIAGAMGGGHGACRGCGETQALKHMAAINRFMREHMYQKRIIELEQLIRELKQKIALASLDEDQKALAEETLLRLRKQLWRYQDGPSGNGPSHEIDVVSTGCQSVYKSTFPYTLGNKSEGSRSPEGNPAVNSLFHDSAPTALGLHAGLSHATANEFKAVRIAKLLLDARYNKDEHEQFFIHFGSAQFTEEELLLAPAIIAYHGDGAANDIGFGAISRALMTKAPIKIAVLDTQAYSNTGGQTSTASPIGSDTDLSKYGKAQQGKQEKRKEIALLAMMHSPDVFVAQIATGNLSHFYRGMQGALEYNNAPALVNTYTACPPEHGTPDDMSMDRARMATRSRSFPVFIRDPKGGDTLAKQLSLAGNSALDRDWVTDKLTNSNGVKREIPYTFAHFAFEEGRFAKHYKQFGTIPKDVLEEFLKDKELEQKIGEILAYNNKGNYYEFKQEMDASDFQKYFTVATEGSVSKEALALINVLLAASTEFEAKDKIAVQDLINLPANEWASKKAYIETLRDGRYIRLDISQTMVASTAERLANWRLLQELAHQTNVDLNPPQQGVTVSGGSTEKSAVDARE